MDTSAAEAKGAASVVSAGLITGSVVDATSVSVGSNVSAMAAPPVAGTGITVFPGSAMSLLPSVAAS